MARLTREVLRKFVHLLGLPIILTYVLLTNYFSPQIGILGLTALLLFVLEIEYLRIDLKTDIGNQITEIFFKHVIRKHEKTNVIGTVFFIIACIISFAAYNYPIALTALFMTVFGDTMSAIFGVAYGKRKVFRNKSYMGTCAGLITNLLVGALMMRYFPTLLTVHIVIPMAITATFVETITKKLDDNLTVPLFAGFIGQAIVYWQKFL